jgi:transposase
MENPSDTPAIKVSIAAAEDAGPPRKLTVRQERSQAARARRIACYEKAVELGRQDVSQREIGRRLGLNRGTVRQYLQTGQFPERAGRHYTSHSDPVADKICKRWAEGCHNAAQIARELIAEKFDGSYYMIRRRVHNMLAQGQISKSGSATGSGTTATVKPPSPTRLSWLLFADECEIFDEDRTLLQAIYEMCAEAKAAGELARAFRRMVRQRQGAHLEEWMSQATTAGAPREIKSFAEFLRQDYDAVKAGLTLPWNNGQLEGQVNRLKLIKRQMFGRASFALLRARVLQAG